MTVPNKPFWASAAYTEFGKALNTPASAVLSAGGLALPNYIGNLAGKSGTPVLVPSSWAFNTGWNYGENSPSLQVWSNGNVEFFMSAYNTGSSSKTWGTLSAAARPRVAVVGQITNMNGSPAYFPVTINPDGTVVIDNRSVPLNSLYGEGTITYNVNN